MDKSSRKAGERHRKWVFAVGGHIADSLRMLLFLLTLGLLPQL